MTTRRLEDFDTGRDGRMIGALGRAQEMIDALPILERHAVANALMTHPITRFVLRSKVESSKYPAISASYQSLSKIILGRRSGNQDRERNADMTDGSPNVIWSLPGHDPDRTRSSLCGVFRVGTGKPLSVKMCTNDPSHFLKAVSNHCCSLRCPNCMNYEAMNIGLTLEERVCTPSDIHGRKTGVYDKPKHWAISPPQEWMKGIMQRSDSYAGLLDDLVALLPAYGFYAGAIVFHPWRLSEDGTTWVLSPHFHAVGFGRFSNMRLREDLARADSQHHMWNDDGRSESWVFNQIHPDEDLRSVRHTFGYIMTHVGLGTFDHDVDWDDAVNDLVIPAEAGRGRVKVARTITPMMVYGDGWRRSNFWTEHLDEFDWLKWTKARTEGSFQSYRVFGAVTRQRVLGRYKERVPRLCPDCGQPIGRFEGIDSPTYEPVMYDRRSTIRVMRDDYDLVRSELSRIEERLRLEGRTALDFAMSVPQCSTPETKGIQDLERLHTPEERAAIIDRVIAYVPSIYGMGYDTYILTRPQYREFQRTGRLPAGAVADDPHVAALNRSRVSGEDAQSESDA